MNTVGQHVVRCTLFGTIFLAIHNNSTAAAFAAENQSDERSRIDQETNKLPTNNYHKPQNGVDLEAAPPRLSRTAVLGSPEPKDKRRNSSNENSQGTNPTFSGNVSWYGIPFHGRKTASGKTFDMNKLTCAHRTLPFGTRIQVENPRTGQNVIVEVIDRGPYAKGRVMDLSREAARRLGILLGGIAYVNCLILAEER